MATTSTSQQMQWLQPKEEVDENFLGADLVVYDGRRRPTRREQESRVSVSDTSTHTARLQYRFDRPAMVDNNYCLVEAWINQELFGDVLEVSQQHEDEGELYLTTLRKDVDEYIEMVDFMRSTTEVSPGINYSIHGEQYHMQSQGTVEDVFSSPVDSEYQGMYYDEPQLWCFT